MWLSRLLRKHHEAVKFLMVGGLCFIATTVINYALKLTVLHEKPVTALTFATVVGTILSYVLNREWAFRSRGGRERRHEAALFFGVSAIATALNVMPLGVSRYLLHLQVPEVTRPVQEVADFVSGMIIGTLIAMVFRLWALKRVVFPQKDARVPSQRRAPRRGRIRTRRPLVQHEGPAPAEKAPDPHH